MRPLVAILLVLATAACGGTRLSLEPDPGPYDRLPRADRPLLHEARAAFDGGDLEGAAAALATLAGRQPAHLATRTFLQEVELALLEAGSPVGDLAPPEEPGQSVGLLFDVYRERAEAAPGAVSLVLAARLAGDGEEALELLAAAEEHDPECIWIRYGRAFRLFHMRRYPEAREAIAAARELDPGHLPTMRLHASMLANAGDTSLAIQVLTAWLERTWDHPLVLRPARAEALVDLAALLVLDGDPKEALALCAEVEVDLLARRSRVDLVRAAAHQDRGDLDLALAAARRAWELGSSSLLPLVQEAMLIAQLENDPDGEREVWERLLEAAAQERGRRAASPPDADEPAVDFQSLLIQLMAHTRLERLRASEPHLGR